MPRRAAPRAAPSPSRRQVPAPPPRPRLTQGRPPRAAAHPPRRNASLVDPLLAPGQPPAHLGPPVRGGLTPLIAHIHIMTRAHTSPEPPPALPLTGRTECPVDRGRAGAVPAACKSRRRKRGGGSCSP